MNRAGELARHNRVLGRGAGVGIRRRMYEASFHSGRSVALPADEVDLLSNEAGVDVHAGGFTLRPQFANQFRETDGVEKHGQGRTLDAASGNRKLMNGRSAVASVETVAQFRRIIYANQIFSRACCRAGWPLGCISSCLAALTVGIGCCTRL